MLTGLSEDVVKNIILPLLVVESLIAFATTSKENKNWALVAFNRHWVDAN